MSQLACIRLFCVCMIALSIGACSSRRTDAAGRVEPYVDGRFVCVDATRTVEVGGQRPPASAPTGCKTWPNDVLDLVREESMCGPCGFELDAVKTASERSDHPTVCCYLVSSPPPPGGGTP